MKLLDFLFPKHCVICRKQDSYLCENCFSYLSFDAKSLCLACDKPTFNGLTHPSCRKKYAIDGCFSALFYNKTTQKLIYNFKYKPYLTDLKIVLSDLFYESIIQNENFNNELKKGKWLMVPVPLSKTKLKKRGYNQAEILANELGKRFQLPIFDLLERIKDTKTQVGMTNLQRKNNVKDAFALKTQNSKFKTQNVFRNRVGPSINLKSYILNRSIFLVDDVATTGSTLLECANVLKRGGAKRVIGLTLARD